MLYISDYESLKGATFKIFHTVKFELNIANQL